MQQDELNPEERTEETEIGGTSGGTSGVPEADLAARWVLLIASLYGAALVVSMAAVNAALALFALTAAVLCFKNFRLTGGRFKDCALKYPSLWVLAVFLLWAAVTWMIAYRSPSLSTFESLRKIWNFLPCFLIPVLGMVFETEKDRMFSRALKVFVAMGVLVAALGAVEYWTGVHYFFEERFGAGSLVFERRFFGFQSHPLHTGALYTVLFLTSLSVGLFKEGGLGTRSFWFGCALLLGLGVLITGSRSYYLASAAGCAVLFMFRGFKLFIVGIVLGVMLTLFVAYVSPYVAMRLRSISVSAMDQSTKHRIFMWRSALVMIEDHPVIGVGYHQWKAHLPRVARANFPRWNFEPATLSHAHNSYLTVAAETGVTGLGLFLMFWLALVREQWNEVRKSRFRGWKKAASIASLACIAAFLVAAFFEHNLLTATAVLAISFVIGLSRLEDDPPPVPVEEDFQA